MDYFEKDFSEDLAALVPLCYGDKMLTSLSIHLPVSKIPSSQALLIPHF